MQGFLLGLANGATCLASCAPVLIPFFLGEGKRVRQNWGILGKFLGGRLVGYLLFACLAWVTGQLIIKDLRFNGLVFGPVYIALAGLLFAYSLRSAIVDHRPLTVDNSHSIVREDRVLPSITKRLACPAPFMSWRVHFRRWPAAIPIVLGFLTGLNLCIPFLAALAESASSTNLLGSLIFFGMFFIGTSIYFIPIVLMGTLRNQAALQTIGKFAAAVMALYYLYSGIIQIAGGQSIMTAIAQANPSIVKPRRPRSPFALGWGKSLVLTLPITAFSTLLVFGNIAAGGSSSVEPLLLSAAVLTWLVMNVFFFLMLYTGQTHRFRSIVFIAMAISLPITFMTSIIEMRGSLALTEANMVSGETPFCHLVIPMTIIPALLTRTIIFPGSLLGGYGIATMIVLWLGATLALGRGWCSWGCFYGGYDEGFSRILRKPKIKNIDRKWTYLPYAVLLGIVLISAVTLSPTYCEWLCPYKAVTEFAAITNITILIQTLIFASLFIGLVIVLPILTKRRTQCGLFCPMGAMQNWTNKLNVYDVRIDTEKCTECGHCANNCQTFSLDESSYKTGQTLISCTKCGQCMDVCPKKAISFHIKGTPVGSKPNLARVLYLYPAYLLMVVLGSGMIATAIWRILKLVTTGSMI